MQHTIIVQYDSNIVNLMVVIEYKTKRKPCDKI